MPLEKRNVAKNPKTKQHARKRSPHSRKYWSARVTETSDALDLKDHVFAQRSPSAIARSLKRSAEKSRRRKSSAYRSAMSMLTFYINRAGKNLSVPQRQKLDRAKHALRELYGRDA